MPLSSHETPIETEFSAPSLSRRTLIAAGAIAVAALTLPARADFNYGDTQRLRFLEELCSLEANFFQKAAMSAPAAALSERESNTLNLIANQDDETSRWFGAARGKYGLSAFDGPSTRNQASSRPVRDYRFTAAPLQTRESLLASAIEIKTLAVGAFHGAVGAAKDPKIVQAFAALAGVQGRHLALLSELNGQSPFLSFEPALGLSEVAARLASYGFNPEVLA